MVNAGAASRNSRSRRERATSIRNSRSAYSPVTRSAIGDFRRARRNLGLK